MNLKINLNLFQKFRTNSRSCNKKYMMVPVGYFNSKCANWYKHDKTSFKGIGIENISSQCELYQVINEPTHFFRKFFIRIDLIFISQPNLNTVSGVHPSLHPNCHHQVIYAKFNLKVHYPIPYEREVCIMKKRTLILFDDQLNVWLEQKIYEWYGWYLHKNNPKHTF